MLHAVSLTLIDVPKNRQRSAMDEPRVEALRASLRIVGQLKPICLAKADGGRFTLIAGERRLRARAGMHEGEAIRCGELALAPGMIAATLWDELSNIQRFEMELEENIRRVDLDWKDQVRAVARLAELRKEQARNTGEVFSTQNLAEEVGIGGQASEAAAKANTMLVVAKHLDDPTVAGAKSLKEAQKAVDKKIKTQQLGQLAAVFEARAAKESPHKLLRGDAFDLMASLPDASFDCAVMDPPYGIDADDFGDQAKEGHEYGDGEAVFERIRNELPVALMRLLRSQAHVYVFCAFERFEELKFNFDLEGFEVWPRPLIWSKGNGMLPKPQHGPRYTFECILFANKGNRPTEYVASDVITVPKVHAPRHGAEKPVALIRDLLGRSMRPGERVLDPFCGSGTIFPAASAAKVAAVGIEMVAKYADLAASRMLEEAQGSVLDIF